MYLIAGFRSRIWTPTWQKGQTNPPIMAAAALALAAPSELECITTLVGICEACD